MSFDGVRTNVAQRLQQAAQRHCSECRLSARSFLIFFFESFFVVVI